MSDGRIIKVGCEAFIIKNNELLLGKRKNCYGEGSWALPGGHLEYGETCAQAVTREMKEELAIDVKKMHLVTVTDDPRTDQHYLHISFVIDEYEGEITNNEEERCEELKYFPLSALPKPIFIAHTKILSAYLDHKLYSNL